MTHPLPLGTVLRCTSDAERVAPVVQVAARRLDIDSQVYHYVLVDATDTERWTYHQDDVESIFEEVGLVCDEPKLVMDRECRDLVARYCDHTFRDVHDRGGDGDIELVGEECITCREYRGQVNVGGATTRE